MNIRQLIREEIKYIQNEKQELIKFQDLNKNYKNIIYDIVRNIVLTTINKVEIYKSINNGFIIKLKESFRKTNEQVDSIISKNKNIEWLKVKPLLETIIVYEKQQIDHIYEITEIKVINTKTPTNDNFLN